MFEHGGCIQYYGSTSSCLNGSRAAAPAAWFTSSHTQAFATTTITWSSLQMYACHRNRHMRYSCYRCRLQSRGLFRFVNWHIVDASLGSVLLLAIPVALLFASALLSTETQNGLTLRPQVSRASSLNTAQLRATSMHMSSEDFEDRPPSVLVLTWLVQLLKVLRCCSHQLAPASTD
jgi:hypothetical protein